MSKSQQRKSSPATDMGSSPLGNFGMAGNRAIRNGQVAQLSSVPSECEDLGAEYEENLRHVQHTAELLGLAEVAVIIGGLIAAIGSPVEAAASLGVGELQNQIVQSGLGAQLQNSHEAQLTSMIRNLQPLAAREIVSRTGDTCPNPYRAVRNGLIELRRRVFYPEPA